MKTSGISIGIAVAAIGLAVAPGLASAQQPNGIVREAKPVDSVRPLHGVRGSKEIDFAAARADAHAKANARQSTDVDVKNKQGQKQAAIGLGVGTGGKSSVNLKNTNNNVNLNSLSTGDVVNYNANDNKQIQSFTVPSQLQRPPVKVLR